MASKTLIAINSIQTTDKAGNRVDIEPGKPFIPASDKERDYLLESRAAKEPDVKSNEEPVDLTKTDPNAGKQTPPAK